MKKPIVKLGTSLVLLGSVGFLLLNERRLEDASEKNRDTIGESVSQSVKKSESLSQRAGNMGKFEAHSLQVLNEKEQYCNSIKEKVAKLNNSQFERSWVNYSLTKDGEQFVFRVEKDVNLQGLEVEKIKFYNLDEEGFPTPVTGKHNQILKPGKNIRDFIKGYQIVDTRSVESNQEQGLFFEKKNGSIYKVKDMRTDTSCLL